MNLSIPFPVFATRWYKTNTSSGSVQALVEALTLMVFTLSVFLLPPVKIVSLWPRFYLSDLLLPLMAYYVFVARSWQVYRSHYIPFLLSFAAYILFTIFINNRVTAASDYYEVIKVLKLIVAVLFIAQATQRFDVLRLLKVAFAIIVLFNIFQYTGWWNFNQIIEPYYSTALQLDTFGLNSIGQPDTRRLLGTMGNPNNNSILFLFFFVLFMPPGKTDRASHGLFLLAFAGCLFSQSRTGLIALVGVYSVGAWLMDYRFKSIAIHFVIFAALYFVFMSADAAYMLVSNDLANIHPRTNAHYLNSLANKNIVQTESVQGRFKVWSDMWEMIKVKPLFGHAPFKEFFYSRNINPDGEYVLMTWRYGLVGLLLYLGSVTLPAIQSLGNPLSNSGKKLVLFTIVLLVTAITNSPMSNPNVMMMLALMVGLYLNEERNTIAAIDSLVNEKATVAKAKVLAETV